MQVPLDYNRRNYQRGSHFVCSAIVRSEGRGWHAAEIFDLSSGGLMLKSAEEFSSGDQLWFDLTIQGFLSEFSVMVKGIVRRKNTYTNEYVYGIEFLNLDQDTKIRIDENVMRDRPVGRDTYQSD